MFDHDQRFKLLLQEFFGDFLHLFFPGIAKRLNLTQVTWLDKEVFAHPPQGERGYLDLIAQVATHEEIPGQRAGEGSSWLALIHVEIEYADSAFAMRSRMFQYYEQLRRRHGKPVLPIVLYLRVGLDGIGKDLYEEYLWEQRVLTFEYLYVGLPALDAESYLQGENWLGVALSALMRAPPERKAALAAEGLQRLVKYSDGSWRQFLLGDCLVSYSSLQESQKSDLTKQLAKEEFREAHALTRTWYDEGLERGLKEGYQTLLAAQLELRFGPLSESARNRLATWPLERLKALGIQVLKASSLTELGLQEQ